MFIRRYQSPEPGDGGGGAAPKPNAPPAPAIPEKPSETTAVVSVAKVEPTPTPAAKPDTKAEPAPAVATPAKPAITPEEFEARAARGLAAFDQLEARNEKARQKAVRAQLRGMGADRDLLPDDVIDSLAPKVDPDLDPTTAGVKLLEFKTKFSKWFNAMPASPRERFTTYEGQLNERKDLTPEQREKRAKLARRLGGDR